MISTLVIHVLESTVVAMLLILLALLMRNRSAAIRHLLWLAAATNFLIPIGLIANLGGQTRSATFLTHVPSLLPERFLVVSPSPGLPIPTNNAVGDPTLVVTGIWIIGTLVMILLWIRRFLDPTSSIEVQQKTKDSFERAKLRMRFHGNVGLREENSQSEPHLFGLRRPTIAISQDLSKHLTGDELEVVFLHELAHARRRDNLSSAFVHIVVCLFWFHPLLRWIERRTRAESEIACDELVLSTGARSEDYLSSIFKVFSTQIGNVVPGVSAMFRSNLNRRMEAIMTFPRRNPATTIPGMFYGLLFALLILVPFLGGIFTASKVYGQADTTKKDASKQEAAISRSIGTNSQLTFLRDMPQKLDSNLHTCVFKSVQYREGDVIQVDGLGQRMCAMVLLPPDSKNPGVARYGAQWIHTSEAIRQRSQIVIQIARETPLPCTPKDSGKETECSCQERGGYSQGSLVNSATGTLRCDKGKWIPASATAAGGR